MFQSWEIVCKHLCPSSSTIPRFGGKVSKRRAFPLPSPKKTIEKYQKKKKKKRKNKIFLFFSVWFGSARFGAIETRFYPLVGNSIEINITIPGHRHWTIRKGEECGRGGFFLFCVDVKCSEFDWKQKKNCVLRNWLTQQNTPKKTKKKNDKNQIKNLDRFCVGTRRQLISVYFWRKSDWVFGRHSVNILMRQAPR